MAKETKKKDDKKVDAGQPAETAATTVSQENVAAAAGTAATEPTTDAGVSKVEEKKEEPKKEEPKKAAVDDGTVAVTVPKAFALRLQNNTLVTFKPGAQRMTEEMFNHPYVKANGVKKV